MTELLQRAPAQARWATKRTPSRPTFGPAIGQVARALGKPLQPWQQQVVDVATELVPDPTGSIMLNGVRHSWAYTTVVVHVQRQAGKTTLLGPKNVHRCLIRPGAKCWLTAQTRQDGRDVWRDVAELVAKSPLANLVSTRRSNGSEELLVPATGASWRVFAPSEDALHGKANESVDVDEVWSFDGTQGLALQQAILPTFTTTGGQLWLTSTAGTAASTWLLSYVERGRAAVEAGETTGIAYFEWSLAPAEAETVAATLADVRRAGGKLDAGDDLADRLAHAIDLTLAAHPGLFVRRQAVVDAALTMPPGEFLRAYGNVWTLTRDTVIADHAWKGCRDRELPAPEPGTVALAFAVPLDRSSAAVGASWHTADHHKAIDLVDRRAGDEWLVERLVQLAGQLRVREVACDSTGPALDVADRLERRGIKVRRLSTREYLTACAGYLADVNAGHLRHRGNSDLDAAAAAAAQRAIGDGWVWSRRHSAGSVAEVEATTVASYVLDHQPPQLRPQLIVAGDEPADTAPATPAQAGHLVLP